MARPIAPHIGRIYMGWTGIEPFGSPICAQEIMPPTSTISGLAPNMAGSQITRSARLPGSIEPISCAMPWAMAGLMVYFAT